jgi:tRNA A37 threonylcarbamoyltransferase TsaD
MDFSFSGLQNKVRQLIGRESNEDLCYSIQETVFAMLVEATERALAHIDKTEILLTGGVAANKRLTAMLARMCKDRGVKFAVCPFSLAGDNGAMIAWQGIVEFNAGKRQKLTETEIDGKWRTDQVKVNWIN